MRACTSSSRRRFSFSFTRVSTAASTSFTMVRAWLSSPCSSSDSANESAEVSPGGQRGDRARGADGYCSPRGRPRSSTHPSQRKPATKYMSDMLHISSIYLVFVAPFWLQNTTQCLSPSTGDNTWHNAIGNYIFLIYKRHFYAVVLGKSPKASEFLQCRLMRMTAIRDVCYILPPQLTLYQLSEVLTWRWQQIISSLGAACEYYCVDYLWTGAYVIVYIYICVCVCVCVCFCVCVCI